jgi:hypothetical protein
MHRVSHTRFGLASHYWMSIGLVVVLCAGCDTSRILPSNNDVIYRVSYLSGTAIVSGSDRSTYTLPDDIVPNVVVEHEGTVNFIQNDINSFRNWHEGAFRVSGSLGNVIIIDRYHAYILGKRPHLNEVYELVPFISTFDKSARLERFHCLSQANIGGEPFFHVMFSDTTIYVNSELDEVGSVGAAEFEMIFQTAPGC